MPPRQKQQEEKAPWETDAQAVSGEVVPANVTPTDIQTKAGPVMQVLVQWLATKASGTDDDTYAAYESMMAQIMGAEDIAQVLTEQTPLHGKEFLDKPFLLNGFEIREGEFEEGAPFYAVLNVTLPATQESRVITCGGWIVLAQLARMEQEGEWPLAMKIRGKKTSKGYTALRLVAPDA